MSDLLSVTLTRDDWLLIATVLAAHWQGRTAAVDTAHLAALIGTIGRARMLQEQAEVDTRRRESKTDWTRRWRARGGVSG